MELSEYEQLREERVARNKAMFNELHLADAAAKVADRVPNAYVTLSSGGKTSGAGAAGASRRRVTTDDRGLLVARRSLRARGMGPVAETDHEREIRQLWADEAQAQAEERAMHRERLVAEARSRGEVTTRGGRPVTWIGGGGQDASELARMGVPDLRQRFYEVFGQATASNNSVWLRKKLAEPSQDGGARRAPQPRTRDLTAHIWTQSGMPPGAMELGDAGLDLLRPDKGGGSSYAAAPPVRHRGSPRALHRSGGGGGGGGVDGATAGGRKVVGAAAAAAKPLRADPCLKEAATFITRRKDAAHPPAAAAAAPPLSLGFLGGLPPAPAPAVGHVLPRSRSGGSKRKGCTDAGAGGGGPVGEGSALGAPTLWSLDPSALRWPVKRMRFAGRRGGQGASGSSSGDERFGFAEEGSQEGRGGGGGGGSACFRDPCYRGSRRKSLRHAIQRVAAP